MIGLITSAESSACRDSASLDQANHRGSSVTTSRSTLLSTSVSATCEREDLVGAQPGGRLPFQARNELGAASPAPNLLDAYDAVPRLERHFRARQEPELLADLDRD